MAEFKSALKDLRKAHNMTQEELSKKLGVSKQVISNWERGYTTSISPEILQAIAKVFNTTTEKILGDQKDAFSDRSDTSSSIHSYFFFFFDDYYKELFAEQIKNALAEIGLTEYEFIDQISIEKEKATKFLTGTGEPTVNDLIKISEFLGTSIDYLLGQVPKISSKEKKVLNSFTKLDEDNQDIIIGKIKELLKEQRNESVAADEPLRKTGTDNLGK